MHELIRYKLKSFSLPETVVALVIIVSVFATATMIIVGTGRTHLSLRELKARDLLQQYVDKTREGRVYISDSAAVEDFLLRREVNPYPAYDSLLRIHYYIYDRNSRLLADWQMLERARQ